MSAGESLIEQTRTALERARCEGVTWGYQARMLSLLQEQQTLAFTGQSTQAHFTASAFLLRRDGAPLALLHAKLGRWLQPGGHMELGDRSPLDAACRELEEETGIKDHRPLSAHPIDLDIHMIPARGEVMAHEHYDLRYGFLLTGDDRVSLNHEARGATWLTGATLERWLEAPSISRAYEHARGLLMGLE